MKKRANFDGGKNYRIGVKVINLIVVLSKVKKFLEKFLNSCERYEVKD
jgi:hypothetical protein